MGAFGNGGIVAASAAIGGAGYVMTSGLGLGGLGRVERALGTRAPAVDFDYSRGSTCGEYPGTYRSGSVGWWASSIAASGAVGSALGIAAGGALALLSKRRSDALAGALVGAVAGGLVTGLAQPMLTASSIKRSAKINCVSY